MLVFLSSYIYCVKTRKKYFFESFFRKTSKFDSFVPYDIVPPPEVCLKIIQIREVKIMKTIQNYDSRANLSTYKINSVYSFYIHNIDLNRLTKVKKKDFKKFIRKLDNVIESNEDLIHNNNHYLNLIRVVGVVVDKQEKTTSNNVDQITVLFKTTTNEYVIHKYAVDTQNVYTNEKNYVLPGAMINIAP